MARVTTKTTRALEERMKQVPQGSLRYQVLAHALDFKNAWIDLGAHLTKVRDGFTFQEWGYDDFDTYCQKELQIRKATADKLTATYSFMQRREPDLLLRAQRDPGARASIPDFDVIHVLSRAEERGQVGDREYREVREHVFEGSAPTPAGLARVINANWPLPPGPEPPKAVRLRRLARAAGRVADEAARTPGVPDAVRERAAVLARDLQQLVPTEKVAVVG